MNYDDDIEIHNLPQVLTISHGGVRGFYELGYLHVLKQNDILKEVDTYIGVSVGAIISLLMICGYEPKEIVNIAIVSEMLSMASINSISQSWSNKGLLSLENIEDTLNNFVSKKFFHVPSYKRLFEITGKTLCTVAVKIKDGKNQIVYFDPISHPNMNCVEGVMASILIPLIMEEKKINGCSYIDGAIGNPYPVDQYDDGETSILGISISTIYKEFGEDENIFSQLANRITRLYQIFDAFTESHKRRIIESCSDKVIHVKIEDDSLDFIGLTKGPKEKSHMLYKGVNIAEEDLKKIKWISNTNIIRITPRKRIDKNKKIDLRKSI